MSRDFALAAHDSAAGDAVIELQGLTRYFGARKVVDGVTMRVPRGSVFAFLGRNGSGKTTTIRMLLGLVDPTRGSARLLGHDSRRIPPAIRERVGYMSESHALYEWMTVRQCGEYQARFYPRWNDRVYRAITDHFRLDPLAVTGKLSRGERAGVSLAMTLAPEPEVLILDDPALGLDPVARRSLLESMVYVTRGADRTIFFSSHLLDDVERVADHIAILDRSVLRACCSVETFRANVRQFALHFAGADTPAVPSVRGLLRVVRLPRELRLIVVSPDDSVHSALGALGALSIVEMPVAFDEAMVGYLGDRGEHGFFLDDSTELAAARAAMMAGATR